MNRNSVLVTAIVCATVLAFSTAKMRAGDLNPPGGPVSSTMKDLDTVEPRTALGIGTSPGGPTDSIIIAQPGSYYLDGNMTGEPDKHGILITSSDVTLDLMGFTMTGSTGMTVGIYADPMQSLSNIEIRNGTIKDWPLYGVLSSAATGVRIEDIHVDGGSQAYGILTGDETSIVDCSVTNAIPGLIGGGIRAANRCRVERCYAAGNRGSGIVAFNESFIIDCISVGNGGDGYDIDDRCVVLRCHGSDNDGDEIVVQGDGSRVEGCVFRQEPDSIGIAAVKIQGEGNVIKGNSITTNEPNSAAIEVQFGRANLLIGNAIGTSPSATDAVAMRLLGGAGTRQNQVILDGPGSIGILLDPGPGAPEACCGEECTIFARGASTVGVRVAGGTGMLVAAHIVVTGTGAIGVDVEATSNYAVRKNEIVLFEPSTIGIRIAAPSYIEQNNLWLLGASTVGISEITGTNSLIRGNTFQSRGATPTAIFATEFGASMMIGNVSIGASGVFTLPEGVQFGQLLVDPGSGYVTDSAANLEISP